MKLSHAMIIRFHYSQDDPRFEWRFSYFQSVVLPRILNQTRDDFDICIRCNDWHKERFEVLSPRIKTFKVKDEFVAYKKSNNRRYFHDFMPWANVIGLEQYDIQTGVDSDDLIREDFIERIYDEIEKNGYGKSLHVYFQPGWFDLKTLSQGHMEMYTDDSASAFFSLYQPDKSHYKFINGYSHLIIGKHASKSVRVPIGYCWATIHYHNESTGK